MCLNINKNSLQQSAILHNEFGGVPTADSRIIVPSSRTGTKLRNLQRKLSSDRWQQAKKQTMEYNKYKIEDINIGDEIYFDSVPSQSNFDEYWAVHGKDKDHLLVNFKKEYYWTVKISKVRQHLKITK